MNRFSLALRLLPVLVGLLSFATMGSLKAQDCTISLNPNCPLTIELELGTSSGIATLEQANATGSLCLGVTPIACVLYFADDLSFVGASTFIDFDCSDVGSVHIIYVRAEDGDPAHTSAPLAIAVTVVDVDPPTFTTCPVPPSVLTANLTMPCRRILNADIDAVASDNGQSCLTTSWTITNSLGSATQSGTGLSVPSGTTLFLGVNTIKFTATDAGNFTTECFATVEVRDNNAPTLTCPIADVEFDSDPLICGHIALASDLDLVIDATETSDNCTSSADLISSLEKIIGSGNFMGDQTPGNAVGHQFPVGTSTMVRYRVTDNAGRTRVCTFHVNVTDKTNPVFDIPATVSGTLDEGFCNSKINLTVPAGKLTDNCTASNLIDLTMKVEWTTDPSDPIYNLPAGTVYDPLKLQFFPLGISKVTFTATDGNANATDFLVTVEILDDEAPIFLNNVPNFGSNGCNNTTVVLNNLPGNCFGLYSWHRPNIFTNDLFECPDLLEVDAIFETFSNPAVAQSVPTYEPFGILQGYRLNPANYSNVVNPTATFPIGETIITYTASDAALPNSNVATCSFKVVVKDTETPTLTCPPSQNISTICTNAQVPNYLAYVNIADNCPNSVTLTQSPVATTTLGTLLGTPMVGDQFTVTVTAKDLSNNTGTCTFEVMIDDDGDAPILTPLASLESKCGFINVPSPTATLPCAPPNSQTIYGSTSGSTVPGSNPPIYVFQPGSYNVLWSYSYGNGNVATQNQSILVYPDTFPAVAKCKAFVTIPLQADGDTIVKPALIDNGSFDDTGCNSPLTFSIIGQTLYNCSDLKDTTEITLHVKDNKNNISTCKTKIDVYDNTPPVFANTPNSLVNIEACSAIPAIAAVTATDKCTTTALTYHADTIVQSNIIACQKFNFDIVRTWTAKDTFNNTATFTQTIKVRDTKAPSFSNSPNNLVFETGPNAATCQDLVNFNIRSSITDCATGVDLTVTPNNGLINQMFSVGQNAVIFTAKDVCANQSTFTFNFELEDATPPIPFCNNAVSTSVNLAGTVTIDSSKIDNGSSDNCAIKTMTVSPNTFDCDDADGVTKHVVRLTVADHAGNTAACETEVVVFDYVSPVITACPADVTILCSADRSVVALGNATATDNCNNTLVISFSDAAPVYGTGFATIIRTFTATDGNNNTSTCEQTIRLTDIIAPTISAMPVNLTLGCPSDVPSLPVITASDNCDPVPSLTRTIATTQSTNKKLCAFYTFVTTRTWTAEDAYHNKLVHTQTITVKDTIKPAITGLLDTFVFASASFPANNSCTVPVNFNINDYITDCAHDTNLVVNVSGAPFGLGTRNISGNYAIGNYKIIFAVSDPCGNTKIDTTVFKVIDNSSPVAVCKDNVVVALGTQGTATLSTAAINNNSTDNCSIPNNGYALSKSSFDCGDLGINSITLTVTDIYGNSNACSVDITIEAGTAAVFNLTTSTTPTSYFGLNNGTAGVTATGGSGNFTYSWHNNATTANITGLAAGPYFVTVTDTGNGCTRTASVTVLDGPKITFTAGTVSGAQGTMALVPVTADQFNNLFSFQFSAHVDLPNIAQVLAIEDVNPALDVPNVLDFVSNIIGNDIGIIWATATGQPLTLPPGSVLFKIKVMLVGGSNSMTPVTLNDTPVDLDVFQSLNGTSVQVPVDLVNGKILINSGTTDVEIGGLVHTWINPEVATSTEKPVANVDVELTGTQFASMTTQANGLYNFTILSGDNSTVDCSKSTAGNNGITAGDLLRIVNQIFGITMPSPYQWVAADVNNDGKVTLADYVIIQRLALGTDQHLFNSPDWKFIPESYVFGNPPISQAVPTPYPTTISHNPALQDFLTDNFVAVRMGDVNGNTPVTIAGGTDDRYDGSEKFIFKIDDRAFKSGETLTVPFRAKDFSDKKAYQMTIVFDPKTLAFENVEMGALPNLTEQNFGFSRLSDGYLSTVWVNRDAVSMAENEVLFTLTFKTLAEKSSLTSVLRPGSEVTRAEAYDGREKTQKIDFEYILPVGGSSQVANFELYQNQPNPFSQFTDVNFRLLEAENATIRISNVAGQVVKTIDRNFEKGLNTVRILRSELGQSGVFWLELSTPTQRGQVKMILID